MAAETIWPCLQQQQLDFPVDYYIVLFMPEESFVKVVRCTRCGRREKVDIRSLFTTRQTHHQQLKTKHQYGSKRERGGGGINERTRRTGQNFAWARGMPPSGRPGRATVP